VCVYIHISIYLSIYLSIYVYIYYLFSQHSCARQGERIDAYFVCLKRAIFVQKCSLLLRKQCALFAKRQSKGISAFAAEGQQAPCPVRAQTRTHSPINTHYDTNIHVNKQKESMACIHAYVYLFWLQIEDLRPLLSCRNSSKFSDSTDHQNTTLRKNFFCCKTNFTYWTTGLRVGRALCRHCFFGNVAHTNVGDDTNEIFILHQTSIFSVSHLCKNLSSYQ
jgi:hypothetical protein